MVYEILSTYYTNSIADVSTPMNIKEKALSLIKIRPHASQELVRKLILRGFNREQSQEVTEQLKEQGLINDEKYLEDYLSELMRHKTFGFYGLLAKLMQRGIAKSDAERALKEKLSLEAETEIARRVLDKKDWDKIKLAQTLSRKGFRAQIISELIKDFPSWT